MVTVTTGRKRILILGGGFGGVYTAIYLKKALKRRADVEIYLVNQENYFVFQPMLGEVISGRIGILHTITPIRHLCPQVNLYVRKVERIDLDRKVVVTSHGFRPQPLEIPYDYLILALGMFENFSAVRGLPEHGLHFKNLGDALVLRNRLIHILEEADIEPDEEQRRSMLTFVMAGGGFSGVEAIAELNDFVRDIVRRYRNVNPEELQVILLHSGPRILPELPEDLSRYAAGILTRRGLDIRLQTSLAAVTQNEAVLEDGSRIPTKTLIATIGAVPNPVLSELPCEKERGRIAVNESLEIPGYPGVWALGDCAWIVDSKTGIPCPPTAQYAVREAKCVAENIRNMLDSKPGRAFSFSARGVLSSLGSHSAAGEILGVKVSGLFAWSIWRFIYWTKLPGFNRKLLVLIDWILDLFLSKDLVQLNLSPSENISREHFEPGEVVFRQGDWGDRFYVIISGEVEVRRADASGEEQVLRRLTEGECFGEMALVNDAPRTATVCAVTGVDALTLRREAFSSLFKYVPALRESFQKITNEHGASDNS